MNILIKEYVENNRKCATISTGNYYAYIKEGAATFEYKMSKSISKLTGRTTLGCKINIDYLEENFDYVIRFVESAINKWSDYEENGDESPNDYFKRFHPLDLPDNMEIDAYTYLEAILNKKTEIEVNDIITKFDLAQENSGGGFTHLSYKHNDVTWIINPLSLEPYSDFEMATIMIDAWIGLRSDTPCIFSLYSIDDDHDDEYFYDDYYDISFGCTPSDSGFLKDAYSLEQGLIHIRDNFNLKKKEFTS